MAQHPLLVRSHYSDIEKIAYVLKCEEEFGEQATLEMVRHELSSCLVMPPVLPSYHPCIIRCDRS